MADTLLRRWGCHTSIHNSLIVSTPALLILLFSSRPSIICSTRFYVSGMASQWENRSKWTLGVLSHPETDEVPGRIVPLLYLLDGLIDFMR